MIGYTQKQKIEQFGRVVNERDRLDLMLHDVANNAVTWGAWVTDASMPGTKYRIGISRFNTYPLAMRVYRYPGQSDSITVHDLDAYETELRQLRARSDVWEPVLRALESAKDKVRAEVAA